MSVIFDQLRISDNGQKMYIDAHVNEASYFADMYLHKITICTEDQVSETDPLSYGEEFIYQEEIVPKESEVVKQIYDKTQVLTAEELLKKADGEGGWTISFESLPNSVENMINIRFTGLFSQFDTGFAPKLVVANSSFHPEDSLLSENIFFTAEGERNEKDSYVWWDFKGKGVVEDYNNVYLYLYAQTAEDVYEFVRIEDSNDFNFLHFYWQAYSVIRFQDQRVLHLVLDKNDFNEQFKAGDLSHNMFFVYIEVGGVPDECTPCRLDEQTTLGVTFDYGIVFNQAMNYTKALAADCVIPHQFLDFILNFEALKLAVETEHYVPAIEYWKNLLNANGRTLGHSITKPCGCHG